MSSTATSTAHAVNQFVQRIPNPARMILGGLAALAIPASYIVMRHIGFESQRDSKIRMLLHHLLVLGSMVPSVMLMHNAMFKLAGRNPNFLEVGAKLLAAGMIPALTFEGGFRITQWLVPGEPNPSDAHGNPTQQQATLAANKPRPVKPADPYNPAASFPGQDVAPSQYLTPNDIANSRPIPSYGQRDPFPHSRQPLFLESPTLNRVYNGPMMTPSPIQM